MGPKRAFVLGLVVLTVGAVAPAAAARPCRPSGSERAVLRLINKVRHGHDLRALRLRCGLWRAARVHSREMLRDNRFAHGDVVRRVSRYAKVSIVGENLAWGTGTYASPSATVRMWMKSPPHRAILLDSDFTEIGIGSRSGRFLGYRGARVVTADFGG